MKKRLLFISTLLIAFTVGAATGTKITAELKNQSISYKGTISNQQVISYKGNTYVSLKAVGNLIKIPVNYKDGIVYLGQDNSTAVTNNQKSSPAATKDYGDISEKIKNYIINGQGNKPEASKIIWSTTFLNQVDIESLYKQYIANGGHADDLESFAKYMTLNAPIPRDWKDLFKKDLYNTYGEKVVRLEHLNGDLYQAYILIDGSEIPYVTVSSRTGNFHG